MNSPSGRIDGAVQSIIANTDEKAGPPAWEGNLDSTESEQKKRKDLWDKTQIIAVILTPIILASFGLRLDSSIRERDLQIKEFEVAVGILKEDPAKNPGSDRLRGWALETFEKYASVRLSAEDRKMLELWRLGTPQSATVSSAPVDPNLDAVLYVTSTPTDARVYIDANQQAVTTPGFYWIKPMKVHRFRIEEGGKSMEGNVFPRESEIIWMDADFATGKNNWLEPVKR